MSSELKHPTPNRTKSPPCDAIPNQLQQNMSASRNRRGRMLYKFNALLYHGAFLDPCEGVHKGTDGNRGKLDGRAAALPSSLPHDLCTYCSILYTCSDAFLDSVPVGGSGLKHVVGPTLGRLMPKRVLAHQRRNAEVPRA